MRKLSAILLISLFIFSQYTRHLSYLGCKIINITTPVNKQCDCEKLNTFENTKDKIPLSPVTHLHVLLDDFFESPGMVSFCSPHITCPANSIHTVTGESEGCYISPWHPPDC